MSQFTKTLIWKWCLDLFGVRTGTCNGKISEFVGVGMTKLQWNQNSRMCLCMITNAGQCAKLTLIVPKGNGHLNMFA